jgi:hypothetical protein
MVAGGAPAAHPLSTCTTLLPASSALLVLQAMAPPLLPPLPLAFSWGGGLLALPAGLAGPCIGVASIAPAVLLAEFCKGAEMEIPQLQGGQLVQEREGKTRR